MRFWDDVVDRFDIEDRVLEAAQHHDEALGEAWRDRMRFRHAAFRSMIETIAAKGDLDSCWTIDDAAAALYAVAHYDTWRELVLELAWSDERYVESMSRLLQRALLRSAK